MRFTGRTVLVTGGGGSGLGGHLAGRFAAEGASVVVADRDEIAAGETAAAIERDGGRAVPVRVDVSDDEDVTAMVRTALEAFGAVDVLVNNAFTSDPPPSSMRSQRTGGATSAPSWKVRSCAPGGCCPPWWTAVAVRSSTSRR